MTSEDGLRSELTEEQKSDLREYNLKQQIKCFKHNAMDMDDEDDGDEGGGKRQRVD